LKARTASDRAHSAKLAGVAPFDRQSAAWRGPSAILGGHAEVRAALYMATLTAVRYQPVLRGFYRRLRERGKQAKVVLVAAMRKLLATINAVLTLSNPFCHQPCKHRKRCLLAYTRDVSLDPGDCGACGQRFQRLTSNTVAHEAADRPVAPQ
jgi:hypothetical protein